MPSQQEDSSVLDAFMEMLLDSPALAPPPGVQSNFIDPPSRRDLSLGILIPFLVIVVTMTLIRLYVKLFIVKKLHIEDYFLLLAFAFEIGHYVPPFHIYTYAPIIHQWDMPIRNIKKFLLDFHVGAIFYEATILVLKSSILLQFLRIFIPRGDRSFTFWMTHIVLWTNAIFYFIIIIMQIFACKPIAKIWDPLITEGKCLNTELLYLVCASFNFALDAAILIWTQKVIWSLQMSTARKLKLGVLFLAGTIACVFGGLGVYMNVRLLRTEDQTYIAGIMALYTFPETASGFLVLCLPVFPKFFKYIMVKFFPGAPAYFKDLKERLFPTKPRSPHAYAAREDEGRNERRQRSLWHITTDASMSQSHVDTISVEPKHSNAGSSESGKGSVEV